jgi:hypothetical protein
MGNLSKTIALPRTIALLRTIAERLKNRSKNHRANLNFWDILEGVVRHQTLDIETLDIETLDIETLDRITN